MSDAVARQVILAIDDAPENLDIIKNILVPEYTVKGAVNGTMALKIAAMQPPDLILLDLLMPEMDGYEVCRRLKADPVTEEIPVIFLTAQDTVLEEAKALMLGAVDFLLKPVMPQLLISRVRVHLMQVRRWKAREAKLRHRIEELEAELGTRRQA
ncbi:MAG: response regulator [Magnetococcales bacterium]|nr:response regulator [Magnetococcales bacterium]